MTTNKYSISRREALRFLVGGALVSFSALYSRVGFAADSGNFRHIYLNPKLREEFFLFLKNVFNLYPEEELHRLILEVVQSHSSDRDIYHALIEGIPDIKPILSELRYSLPSLREQKRVMCEQTLSLLDGKKEFYRYIEVGTTGRYYDRLSDAVSFRHRPLFIHTDAPSYHPLDIVERGQIRKFGSFASLNDYRPISKEEVSDESFDLMTVYIGFHHAPPKNRDTFIESCHRVLKRGGVLIVRDHDVDSADMTHFVALAHDVFNAGFEIPWQDNEVEVRNFLPLGSLITLLESKGFRSDDRRLLQEGDPTRNTLLRFTKV